MKEGGYMKNLKFLLMLLILSFLLYGCGGYPEKIVENRSPMSSSDEQFSILYTRNDLDYKEIVISEMDSFYQNDTWFVNYKDLESDIGSFKEYEVDLVYNSGVVRAVFPIKELDHAHILTVTKSGKDIQHPLSEDRIDRNDKIYIPIEVLLSKINEVEYSEDGNQMKVSRINKMSQVIEKVTKEEADEIN